MKVAVVYDNRAYRKDLSCQHVHTWELNLQHNKDARALRIMESYIEKNPHDGYMLTKLDQLYSRLKSYVQSRWCIRGT